MAETLKHDYLKMSGNAKVQKMLQKNGSIAESVLYSVKVTKVNRKGKHQPRALLLTDKALYNLKPNDYTKCKRRIGLDLIGAITVSTSSDEFVLHIPDEYDYRFVSDHKDRIAKTIRKFILEKIGRKLKTKHVGNDNLEQVTITKDKIRHLTREEIMQRKRQLANEAHASDEEEANEGKEVFEQLINSKEKVSINSFDLIKVLGRGSFGKVMLVCKKDTGQFYAMKILKKNMIIARQQVEHTRAERKILESLQHPFLMGLRFAFQSSSKLYLVMDFYKGGELFFHLKNKRRFTENEARLIVFEVALAIGHLHSLNFIYRDLKPENILMDEQGHICLTDFGLSKDLDPDNPESQTFCGTPEYLAPEILLGIGHGKAVDWWSLGILLYELTVGIPPFYSRNQNDMYHKIQHGALRFPPSMSDDCRNLIVQLLNRDPKTRLGSSAADVEELAQHPFFAVLDRKGVLEKTIEPAYKPKIKADMTANFDAVFTKEAVVDSIVAESHLTAQAQDEFVNFTYNPSSEGNQLTGGSE